MTAAQIFEWSALGTSPVIANVLFYLAIPTVSKRFPTTHQLIGWLALVFGVFYLAVPFTGNLWFAVVNLMLTIVVFWYIWNAALKKVEQESGTIPVFFFKGSPKYGKNIIRI